MPRKSGVTLEGVPHVSLPHVSLPLRDMGILTFPSRSKWEVSPPPFATLRKTTGTGAGQNSLKKNSCRRLPSLNRVAVRGDDASIQRDDGGRNFKNAYASNRDLSIHHRNGITKCVLDHHGLRFRLRVRHRGLLRWPSSRAGSPLFSHVRESYHNRGCPTRRSFRRVGTTDVDPRFTPPSKLLVLFRRIKDSADEGP